MPQTRLPAMADNMVCMWKPAQSGKTREMQRIIRQDDGVKNHLNILICSNNRGLVAQTNARMTTGLYDDVSSVDEDGPADDTVEDTVYSWMSGTKKTNITARDLAMRVLLKEVSMIVCCAHKARFRYLHELLGILEQTGFAKPVNVWIDEADVSVRYWAGDFDFSKRFPWINKVYAVSATFDAVREFYERMPIMPFLQTHPECYRGLTDCTFISTPPSAGGALAYATEIVDAHPELRVKGMRVFVPGDIERASHDAIARMLTVRGFIVLVLNGAEKGFRFPDGRILPIELSLDTELSATLAEMYAAEGMINYPLAVTGQLCLGRGITFQSEDFLFDYAVLPDMKDAASAYQCAARVLGNTGDFDGDIKVKVYLSDAMRAKIERQERIAKTIAQLVYVNGWANVGDREIALAAGEDPDAVPEVPRQQRILHVRDTREFASPDAAKDYYVAKFGSDVGFGSKLQKDRATGKLKCSFANIPSGVQPIEVVRANLATGNLWGQNYYSLFDETNPVPQIGTLKVGYAGDVPTFVLCVAKAGQVPFEL